MVLRHTGHAILPHGYYLQLGLLRVLNTPPILKGSLIPPKKGAPCYVESLTLLNAHDLRTHNA